MAATTIEFHRPSRRKPGTTLAVSQNARASKSHWRRKGTQATLVTIGPFASGPPSGLRGTFRTRHKPSPGEEKRRTMGRYVYLFGDGKADGTGSQKDLLGGKGAGLAEMTRIGVPVPAGFTITTEVAVDYSTRGAAQALGDEVRAEVGEALSRVEAMMGRKLGDPQRPLLVSVRSGARAWMPGMLDIVLNLDINDEVARSLGQERGSERFAFD